VIVPGSTKPTFEISFAIRRTSARCSGVGDTRPPWQVGIHHVSHSTQYIYGVLNGHAEALAVVASWRPTAFGEVAAEFARSAVALCAPVSVVRARTLLWSCASLCHFSTSVGLEAVPQVLFHPSVVERFVLVGLPGVTESRRRCLRAPRRACAVRAVAGCTSSHACTACVLTI
jgi:hypothetical protein